MKCMSAVKLLSDPFFLSEIDRGAVDESSDLVGLAIWFLIKNTSAKKPNYFLLLLCYSFDEYL